MDTLPSNAPLAQRVLSEQIAAFLLIFNTIFRSRMVFVLVIGGIMYAELPGLPVIIYTAAHFLLSLVTLQIPRWMRKVPYSESKRWARAITICTIAAGVADGVAPGSSCNQAICP